jgi:hypothetical protein
MSFGCSANVLDTARLVKKSWDSITVETIESCWVHSKCLPHLTNEICANGGLEYKKQIQRKVVQDICFLLTNMSISNRDKLVSIIPEIKNDRDGENVVSRWLDLESDPEILALEEIELFEAIEKNL